MEINTFSNFLTPEMHYEVVQKTLFAQNWYFGARSNGNVNDILFWKLDLDSNKLFTDVIFKKILEATNINLKLHRVYANGQTHGLCGSLHVDEEKDNFYTFLYYVNPVWDLVYGGNTVFFNKQSEQIHIEPFVPNKAVFFKSNIPHVGMDPSRHCNKLRVTLAYKLEK
jgi:hypothetical protein